MAQLVIALLPGMQVTLEGVPVAGFRSTKTQALLAYLAMEAERPHRRETLAGLLWPDQPESIARHNVSQALLQLRAALGDQARAQPCVLATRQTIQWNPASDYWLDATACIAQLATCQTHPHQDLKGCPPCIQRLQEAVTL